MCYIEHRIDIETMSKTAIIIDIESTSLRYQESLFCATIVVDAHIIIFFDPLMPYDLSFMYTGIGGKINCP